MAIGCSRRGLKDGDKAVARTQHSPVMHFGDGAWVMYCGGVTIELAGSTMVVIDTTRSRTETANARKADVVVARRLVAQILTL